MSDIHIFTRRISFGDCDPAGIVFYPNIFRWVDETFQDWLRPFGGHAALCAQLDAVGFGLMDSAAQFRVPLREGDLLTLAMKSLNWGNRAITLTYDGRIGETLAFEVRETRGVFLSQAGRLTAGQTKPLRALVDPARQG